MRRERPIETRAHSLVEEVRLQHGRKADRKPALEQLSVDRIAVLPPEPLWMRFEPALGHGVPVLASARAPIGVSDHGAKYPYTPDGRHSPSWQDAATRWMKRKWNASRASGPERSSARATATAGRGNATV